MRRTAVRGSSRAVLVMLVLVAAAATDAAAQNIPERNFYTGMRRAVGYSGQVPEALLGVGAWAFLGESRFGVFVDGKMTYPKYSSHSNYCPPALQTCSVEWVEANRLSGDNADFIIRDENDWFILNGGMAYAVAPEFAVMVGAGMARRSRVREYLDDEESAELRITESGSYFAPHGDTKWEPQAVASVMMRASNYIAFSFGVETGPRGMTVGLYFVLP
jgi:hypothetical protein